jgi:cytochrome c556
MEKRDRLMKRTLVVAGLLLLGMSAVVAQQSVANQTQTTMKNNAKALGGMIAMVKGEKPYDQHAVDTGLAALEETAKKLPTMFPDSIKGLKVEGDYNSSPKVWEDKAGFTAKIQSFAKVVTDAKGKIKDLDSLKATAPAIGKECGGCHETYRLKNT